MLLIVGCNHRSAPLALRERLAFSEEELPAVLARVVEGVPVAEALLLSTCNRVELLVRGDGEDVAGLVEAALGFLARERGLAVDELRRHGYQLTGREAVRHLFSVATGLDSMVLGEPQILGQVKQAYRIARRAGTTGAVLEKLLQLSLSTAKRIRNETGISRHAVSVAFAAVSLARQIFGELRGRTALVLGAGKMGELVARHLVSQQVDRIWFAGRTFGRAVSAAERFGGFPLEWQAALESLRAVDIVVCCTGASQPVLDKAGVQAALRGRHGQPLLLVDIAVPRDVDPAVNGLDDVYLYDIDGLQAVTSANLAERQQAAQAAHRAIASEVEKFSRWTRALEATPTIIALRDRLSALGERELERHANRLASLSPDERLGVDALLRGVIRKVLHRPLVHLRRTVEQGNAEECIALYRRIFGLDDAPGDDASAAGRLSGEEGPPSGPRRLLRGGRED
jgi:glutamyl-tRNA reductase